jgi:hypothetical protein
MKKRIGLLVASVALIVPPWAWADVSVPTSSPSVDSFHTNMYAARQTLLSDIASSYAAFTAETSAGKSVWSKASAADKQSFYDTAKNVVPAKFDTIISELGSYQSAVSDMIDAMKKSGKNMIEAQGALSASSKLLSQARAKIENIKFGLPADPSPITPDFWGAIRLSAREARDELKESREDLHEAILIIENLNGGADVSVPVRQSK